MPAANVSPAPDRADLAWATLPVVAHILASYLPITQNWIFHQLRFTRGVRSIVLAAAAQNLAEFPWGAVYCREATGALRGLWRGFARRLHGYEPLFRAAAEQEGAALLHAHFGHVGLESLGLARALGLPLVTSFYGMDLWRHRQGPEALRRSYQPLFAHGSLFLVEGPAARAQLERLGCPPDRIRVHKLGIDPSEMPCRPRRPQPGVPLRVLMAARFLEKKGLPYGVEAFCRVAREEPGIALTVAGDATAAAPEQRIKQQLQELVLRYGVASRTRFAGFLRPAELRALALEHHLFLQPSVRAANGDSEGGHPVILTEVAASGMAMIGTRHCDIPEIVVHGQTGWLCPERDVDCLAAALREALHAPEKLAEYGANARRLVEARYDARKSGLGALYRSLLG